VRNFLKVRRDKIVFFASLAFLLSCEVKTKTTGGASSAAQIYIYESANDFSPDTMHMRSYTSLACSDRYQDNSLAWGINCSNFVALVGLSSDHGVSDFPLKYGVPSSAPVLKIDGGMVAANWTDLIDDNDTVLSGTGFSSVQQWTGFQNGGALDSNCDDWSSDFSSEEAVLASVNAAGAWNSVRITCDAGIHSILCLCW
jgi:hypothetical protein